MQQTIPQLIEEAAAIAGSRYKLAQELGITPQDLYAYERETRACPVDVQAVMASIVGSDPISALVEATAARLSETRRERLRAALHRTHQLVGNF